MALLAGAPFPSHAVRRVRRIPVGLACGLALAGGWLWALGVTAPTARASSPEAWKAYDKEVRQACLKASGLKEVRVVGQRIDVPELSLSVLLLTGRYPQPSLAGRSGRELCLFSQQGRRAVVAGAEALDQPRWPYPAPGGMPPESVGGSQSSGGLAR